MSTPYQPGNPAAEMAARRAASAGSSAQLQLSRSEALGNTMELSWRSLTTYAAFSYGAYEFIDAQAEAFRATGQKDPSGWYDLPTQQQIDERYPGLGIRQSGTTSWGRVVTEASDRQRRLALGQSLDSVQNREGVTFEKALHFGAALIPSFGDPLEVTLGALMPQYGAAKAAKIWRTLPLRTSRQVWSTAMKNSAINGLIDAAWSTPINAALLDAAFDEQMTAVDFAQEMVASPALAMTLGAIGTGLGRVRYGQWLRDVEAFSENSDIYAEQLQKRFVNEFATSGDIRSALIFHLASDKAIRAEASRFADIVNLLSRDAPVTYAEASQVVNDLAASRGVSPEVSARILAVEGALTRVAELGNAQRAEAGRDAAALPQTAADVAREAAENKHSGNKSRRRQAKEARDEADAEKRKRGSFVVGPDGRVVRVGGEGPDPIDTDPAVPAQVDPELLRRRGNLAWIASAVLRTFGQGKISGVGAKDVGSYLREASARSKGLFTKADAEALLRWADGDDEGLDPQLFASMMLFKAENIFSSLEAKGEDAPQLRYLAQLIVADIQAGQKFQFVANQVSGIDLQFIGPSGKVEVIRISSAPPDKIEGVGNKDVADAFAKELNARFNTQISVVEALQGFYDLVHAQFEGKDTAQGRRAAELYVSHMREKFKEQTSGLDPDSELFRELALDALDVNSRRYAEQLKQAALRVIQERVIHDRVQATLMSKLQAKPVRISSDNLTDAEKTFATFFKGVFGVDVEFTTNLTTSGLVDPESPNRMFVKRGTSGTEYLYAIGHELVHILRFRNPAKYHEFVRAIDQFLANMPAGEADEVLKKIRADIEARYVGDENLALKWLSDKNAHVRADEFSAHLGAYLITRKEFWSFLDAEIAKSPEKAKALGPIFRKLKAYARIMLMSLNKLLLDLRLDKLAKKLSAEDLATTRDVAAAEALARKYAPNNDPLAGRQVAELSALSRQLTELLYTGLNDKARPHYYIDVPNKGTAAIHTRVTPDNIGLRIMMRDVPNLIQFVEHNKSDPESPANAAVAVDKTSVLPDEEPGVEVFWQGKLAFEQESDGGKIVEVDERGGFLKIDDKTTDWRKGNNSPEAAVLERINPDTALQRIWDSSPAVVPDGLLEQFHGKPLAYINFLLSREALKYGFLKQEIEVAKSIAKGSETMFRNWYRSVATGSYITKAALVSYYNHAEVSYNSAVRRTLSAVDAVLARMNEAQLGDGSEKKPKLSGFSAMVSIRHSIASGGGMEVVNVEGKTLSEVYSQVISHYRRVEGDRPVQIDVAFNANYERPGADGQPSSFFPGNSFTASLGLETDIATGDFSSTFTPTGLRISPLTVSRRIMGAAVEMLVDMSPAIEVESAKVRNLHKELQSEHENLSHLGAKAGEAAANLSSKLQLGALSTQFRSHVRQALGRSLKAELATGRFNDALALVDSVKRSFDNLGIKFEEGLFDGLRFQIIAMQASAAKIKNLSELYANNVDPRTIAERVERQAAALERLDGQIRDITNAAFVENVMTYEGVSSIIEKLDQINQTFSTEFGFQMRGHRNLLNNMLRKRNEFHRFYDNDGNEVTIVLKNAEDVNPAGGQEIRYLYPQINPSKDGKTWINASTLNIARVDTYLYIGGALRYVEPDQNQLELADTLADTEDTRSGRKSTQARQKENEAEMVVGDVVAGREITMEDVEGARGEDREIQGMLSMGGTDTKLYELRGLADDIRERINQTITEARGYQLSLTQFISELKQKVRDAEKAARGDSPNPEVSHEHLQPLFELFQEIRQDLDEYLKVVGEIAAMDIVPADKFFTEFFGVDKAPDTGEHIANLERAAQLAEKERDPTAIERRMRLVQAIKQLSSAELRVFLEDVYAPAIHRQASAAATQAISEFTAAKGPLNRLGDKPLAVHVLVNDDFTVVVQDTPFGGSTPVAVEATSTRPRSPVLKDADDTVKSQISRIVQNKMASLSASSWARDSLTSFSWVKDPITAKAVIKFLRQQQAFDDWPELTAYLGDNPDDEASLALHRMSMRAGTNFKNRSVTQGDIEAIRGQALFDEDGLKKTLKEIEAAAEDPNKVYGPKVKDTSKEFTIRTNRFRELLRTMFDTLQDVTNATSYLNKLFHETDGAGLLQNTDTAGIAKMDHEQAEVLHARFTGAMANLFTLLADLQDPSAQVSSLAPVVSFLESAGVDTAALKARLTGPEQAEGAEPYVPTAQDFVAYIEDLKTLVSKLPVDDFDKLFHSALYADKQAAADMVKLMDILQEYGSTTDPVSRNREVLALLANAKPMAPDPEVIGPKDLDPAYKGKEGVIRPVSAEGVRSVVQVPFTEAVENSEPGVSTPAADLDAQPEVQRSPAYWAKLADFQNKIESNKSLANYFHRTIAYLSIAMDANVRDRLDELNELMTGTEDVRWMYPRDKNSLAIIQRLFDFATRDSTRDFDFGDTQSFSELIDQAFQKELPQPQGLMSRQQEFKTVLDSIKAVADKTSSQDDLTALPLPKSSAEAVQLARGISGAAGEAGLALSERAMSFMETFSPDPVVPNTDPRTMPGDMQQRIANLNTVAEAMRTAYLSKRPYDPAILAKLVIDVASKAGFSTRLLMGLDKLLALKGTFEVTAGPRGDKTEFVRADQHLHNELLKRVDDIAGEDVGMKRDLMAQVTRIKPHIIRVISSRELSGKIRQLADYYSSNPDGSRSLSNEEHAILKNLNLAERKIGLDISFESFNQIVSFVFGRQNLEAEELDALFRDFKATIVAVNDGKNPDETAFRHDSLAMNRFINAMGTQGAVMRFGKKTDGLVGNALFKHVRTMFDGLHRSGNRFRERSLTADKQQKIADEVALIAHVLAIHGMYDTFRANSTHTLQVIMEIQGLESGNPQAKEVAQVYKNLMELHLGELARAGVAVHAREGFAFPQTHNPSAITKAGFEQWRTFVENRVDWERTAVEMGIEFKDEASKSDYLLGVFSKIVEPKKLDPDNEFQNSVNVSRAVASQRALILLPGQATFDYDMKFGSMDTAQHMISSLVKRAETVILARWFGPKFDAFWKEYLGPKLREDPRYNVVHGEYLMATGQLDNPVDVKTHEISVMLQTLGRLMSMGMSGITNMIDVANLMATQVWQGMPFTQVAAGFMGSIKTGYRAHRAGPGDPATIMLQSTTAGVQSLLLGLTRNLTGEFPATGRLASLQNRFFRWNGMNLVNSALQYAAADMTSKFHAEELAAVAAGTSTNERLKAAFYRFGMDEGDMRKLATFIKNERVFNNEPRLFADYITDPDLRTKYRSLMQEIVSNSINDPDLQSQAMVRGAGLFGSGLQAGTPGGEALRNVTMFSSVLLSVTNKVYRRVFNGYDTYIADRGSATSLASNVKTRYVLDMLAFLGTAMAAAWFATAAKDILSGKEPINPTNMFDPDNVERIFQQSGAGGAVSLLFGLLETFGWSDANGTPSLDRIPGNPLLTNAMRTVRGIMHLGEDDFADALDSSYNSLPFSTIPVWNEARRVLLSVIVSDALIEYDQKLDNRYRFWEMEYNQSTIWGSF